MPGEYKALLSHLNAYQPDKFNKNTEVEYVKELLKRLSAVLQNKREKDLLLNDYVTLSMISIFAKMDFFWEKNANLIWGADIATLSFLSEYVQRSTASRFMQWMPPENEENEASEENEGNEENEENGEYMENEVSEVFLESENPNIVSAFLHGVEIIDNVDYLDDFKNKLSQLNIPNNDMDGNLIILDKQQEGEKREDNQDNSNNSNNSYNSDNPKNKLDVVNPGIIQKQQTCRNAENFDLGDKKNTNEAISANENQIVLEKQMSQRFKNRDAALQKARLAIAQAATANESQQYEKERWCLSLAISHYKRAQSENDHALAILADLPELQGHKTRHNVIKNSRLFAKQTATNYQQSIASELRRWVGAHNKLTTFIELRKWESIHDEPSTCIETAKAKQNSNAAHATHATHAAHATYVTQETSEPMPQNFQNPMPVEEAQLTQPSAQFLQFSMPPMIVLQHNPPVQTLSNSLNSTLPFVFR